MGQRKILGNITWKELSDHKMDDIPNVHDLINQDIRDRYYKLLKDNNLDPNLHEPELSFGDVSLNSFKYTVIIKARPINPINHLPFSDESI